MRQMSEAKTGDERLAKDALVSIMKEEKPNQKETVQNPKRKNQPVFCAGDATQKIEDTIVKALELYRKRQRSFREITLLPREQCAHLQGTGVFAVPPLHTLPPHTT